MHEPIKASNVRLRPVRLWLLISAAMILLTLVVGGATRLTESGLSIVEWKPVTGILPPFSQAEWQVEFAKYRAIPQYHELNRGMRARPQILIRWRRAGSSRNRNARSFSNKLASVMYCRLPR